MVPVLFITGYSGDRQTAVAATPHAAVLPKPFQGRELLRAAQALLAGTGPVA
jgi:DNA-binding response OmpR family regulator